jgi:hypothetical protein
MSTNEIILEHGKYNSYCIQVEPMIAWFTTTELGMLVWSKFDNLTVYPMFESFSEGYENVIIKKMPEITLNSNEPVIIKYGSLVDNFTDFVKGPPQKFCKIALNILFNGEVINLYEFYYQIPKYWAGPIDEDVPPFNFLINSCTKLLGDYETVPEKFPYQLFELFKYASYNSDLNVLLGDNIYLSNYQYDTETGLIQRYKKLLEFPQLKGAWSSCAWSAIPDDHDLGVNDISFGGPGLYLCRDVFSKFWPNNNQNNISPLMWSTFKYDLSFVGLDCRSFSTEPGNIDSTILGDEQLKWLRQTFFSIKKLNKNSFIFICTAVPFIRPRKSYYNNYANDQAAIINMIKEFNLKNVIFLTGSAHYSEISQWPISEDITITEFMCSPMGTIPRDEIDYELSFPPNPYSVNGTVLLNENNFGQISVSGKYNKRKLVYNVYLGDGRVATSFEMEQKL